jgi:O-antigen/teichoic acid export membrane protein
MTLRQQATLGAFWVGVSSLANNLFTIVIRYILMRMLLPEAFGLVSMAYIAIDLLQMFREMGLSSALIYRKGDIRKAADTTFVILILVASVLTSVAFLSSPFVAGFFRTPQLANVLRVLSLNILISALGEVQLALLAKNLAFRQRLLPDLVPTVAYGVVAILLATMGMGVWSIVVARLVDSALTATLAWVVVPWWRPKLQFDRQEARELFDYGKHILGSSLLVFGITKLDNVFVGRVLGSEPLGFYDFAYNQANLPATHISRIIGQVLFPAYSKIQDNLQTLRSAFFRTLHYVGLLAVPLSVGMMAFAGPFVYTLYGDQWAPAILPLQVLGIYGLLRALAVNMGSVFKAGGKPQWLTYIAFVRLAVMGIFLYPSAIYFGIVGVSVLSAAVSIVDFFLSAYLTNRIIHGRFGEYIRALWVAIAGSVLSAAAARWAYAQVAPGHGFIALMMAGIIMVLIYGFFVLIFDQEIREVASKAFAAVGRLSRDFLGNGGESTGE